MVKVIGIKNIDYVRKSDSKRVQGIEIVYTFESKHFEGVNADRVFIGNGVIEQMYGEVPGVGDQIEFLYGKARDGRAYVNGWKKAV